MGKNFHKQKRSGWRGLTPPPPPPKRSAIVGKKRDPGILDPELFLAQIRKVGARLGKLAKIRKSVIN